MRAKLTGPARIGRVAGTPGRTAVSALLPLPLRRRSDAERAGLAACACGARICAACDAVLAAQQDTRAAYEKRVLTVRAGDARVRPERDAALRRRLLTDARRFLRAVRIAKAQHLGVVQQATSKPSKPSKID